VAQSKHINKNQKETFFTKKKKQRKKEDASQKNKEKENMYIEKGCMKEKKKRVLLRSRQLKELRGSVY